MSKIVIIEGVDRCGKSTMAAKLSQDTGFPIVHFGVPPTEDTAEFYFSQINKAMADYTDGFILDRSFYSNRVYNGVFGGGILTDQEFEALVNDTHIYNEVYFVLMVSHPAAVSQRIDSDPESAGKLSPQAVLQMQTQFRNLLHDAPFTHKHLAELPLYLDLKTVANLGRPIQGTHLYLELLKDIQGTQGVQNTEGTDANV